MARSTISFMVILVCVDAVGGYSQGPPRSSCAEMAPDPGQYRHEADPQNTTAPYSVTIDVPDEGAAAGESYQVNIASTPGTSFRGFMCQVRNVNSSDTAAIGNFSSFNTAKAKNLDCTSRKGSVVHKNSYDISNFSAMWEAPSLVSGHTHLIVYCTIVQVRRIYWVKVPSSPFILKTSPNHITVHVHTQSATPTRATTKANYSTETSTTLALTPIRSQPDVHTQTATPTRAIKADYSTSTEMTFPPGGSSVAVPVASVGILFLGLLLQASLG